jgi:hypothetical protein
LGDITPLISPDLMLAFGCWAMLRLRLKAARQWISGVGLVSEETAPGGGIYQQCLQGLQRPHPDYAKVQALANSASRGTLREVARQAAEAAPQLTVASSR